MKGIVFAALTPHPPVLIPEIGSVDINKIAETQKSMRKLASEMKEVDPDLIITVSPHGPVFSDAINILSAKELTGDFSDFGYPDIKQNYQLDLEFIKELALASNKQEITTAQINAATARKLEVELTLDHGVMVPLHYLNEVGIKKPIVPINIGLLPYEQLYTFGKIIQLVAERLDLKVAIIASGDLSHRLTPNAPAGFNPKGGEFDKKIVNYLDELTIEKIFDLDTSLIQQAGECGLRPIIIMLGALDRLKLSGGILSYEGPFGVGYAVATYQVQGKAEESSLLDSLYQKKEDRLAEVRSNESYIVKLARHAVESYINNQTIIDIPKDIKAKLSRPGGVFVSIKKNGNLRGCIGTTRATQESLAKEIINNAISAAVKDPRFNPVNINEVEELTYSVDILDKAEEVDDISQLDPKEYGIIVRKGDHSGLLLPNLEGVDTVQKQLEIAKRKANILLEDNDIELMRFKVKRYK